MKRFIPSPAMVVALLALAVALSGSAYAAIKIGTNNIKNSAVTAPKIKNGAVTFGKVSSNARLDLKGALAYAQVNALNPSLIAQRTSGVTAVRRQSPGIYCMTLEASVADRFFDDAGQPARPVVASLEFGNTTTISSPFVLVRGASINCNLNEVEIHTDAPYGTPNDSVSFTFIIP